MAAVVLCQIPDSHGSSTVAADDLALVGVNHDVIDGAPVTVGSLDGAAACFPDLDIAIFRGCDHPLALAVECNSGDITSVTFEGEEGIGVRRLDIVQLDGVVASGC